jgi:multiple sugar transport system substrate-binding protein
LSSCSANAPRFARWRPFRADDHVAAARLGNLVSTLLAVIGIVCALLAGCESSKPAPPATEKQEASRAALAGLRLKLLVVDDPGLAAAAERLRSEWHTSTGAEFEVFEMTEAELLAAERIECDAIVFPEHNLGELAERGWLSPLPTHAIDDRDFGLDWPGIFETIRKAEAVWGDQVLAVPFGSPVFVCAYRADWFERFDREPPRTWAEYQALAEFFSNQTNIGDAAPVTDSISSADSAPTTNTAFCGAIEPWGASYAGLTLLARAATYARHRDFYSTLFDMETMEPLVAGPPFVRALDELVAVSRKAPAELRSGSLAEVRDWLLQGRSAMALVWLAPAMAVSDSAQKSLHSESGTTEPPTLGFVELPGGVEMYNPGLKTWERRHDDEAERVTFLGAAGRLGAVVGQTAGGDAAARLLAWLSGPQWSEQVSAASAATTLFRKTHLESPLHWVGPRFGAGVAGPYAETVAKALDGHASFAAPRIPGNARYLEALDRAVRRALADEATSQQALDTVAGEWQKITDEMGADRQRSAYRRSLGLR